MNQHKGNTQPSIAQEEHEGTLSPYTKRVVNYGYDGTQKNIFYVDDQGTQRSIVTVASNINASFGGNVTLNPSPNQIGSVTISHPITATFGGNVTLNPSPNQIGSVTISHPITATFGGNVTLNTSPNFIGLTTTVIGSSPTLFAVVNTGAVGTQNSLATLLASDQWIGLVSTASIQGKVEVTNTVPVTGTFWQSTQPVSFAANVTLNPSPNYIGLVTVANTVPVTGTFWQNTQPVSFTGNVTLNPSPNYIGLVTVANSVPVTGTFWQSTQPVSMGNATLNPSPNFIGLATVNLGYQPITSTYTSMATIFSAAGSTVTLSVPPASNRFILKDLIVSSLGRNEVQVLSGATILIPYISLSTTGGYISNFGDSGLRGKAVGDALVFGISSAATVSVFANLRFDTV